MTELDDDDWEDEGYGPAQRLYTLAEIDQLAKQWRDENHISVDTQFAVSHLLLWLQQREKERE